MGDWKNVGSNIMKLEGYGLYVTYIDSKVYTSEIIPQSGHPKLDPDKCIEWSELKEPPNQKFLNLVNARFETSFTMSEFGSPMKVTDIRDFSKQQEEMKEKLMTDGQAAWLVKNLREKDK